MFFFFERLPTGQDFQGHLIAGALQIFLHICSHPRGAAGSGRALWSDSEGRHGEGWLDGSFQHPGGVRRMPEMSTPAPSQRARRVRATRQLQRAGLGGTGGEGQCCRGNKKSPVVLLFLSILVADQYKLGTTGLASGDDTAEPFDFKNRAGSDPRTILPSLEEAKRV